MQSEVKYTVKLRAPSVPYYDITCVVEQPEATGQVFRCPTWIPGSYLIRDFAKHINAVRATDSDGKAISITKTDTETWQCAPCDGPLQLTYEVYANDLSVRGAFVTDTYAFFNGTSLFLEPIDLNAEFSVNLLAPAAKTARSWQVATALSCAGTSDKQQFGIYTAPDYQTLIDCPVVMGELVISEFSVDKAKHQVVFFGDLFDFNIKKLTTDLKAICEHHKAFFGDPFIEGPHVFLNCVTEKGYGGLEHKSSCFQMCSRYDLPTLHESDTNNYAGLLELLSHEYWHRWLVKRIKPRSFAPYQLDKAYYTKDLWVYEGITSYMDALSLPRAGVVSPEKYLDTFAKAITTYLRTLGRFKQTLEESSFDAWIKFYKPEPNTINDGVSYYVKGSLVAFGLDMLLREHSHGACRLKNLLQVLWQTYGDESGVPDGGVEACAIKVAQDYGIEPGILQSFFEIALRSTDELNLASYFEKVGVEYHERAVHSELDRGGVLKLEANHNHHGYHALDLGLLFKPDSHDLVIDKVLINSCAQDAGLKPGDELVALDGFKVGPLNLSKLLTRMSHKEAVEFNLFRDGVLKSAKVLKPNTMNSTCELRFMDSPNAEQKQFQKDWLNL